MALTGAGSAKSIARSDLVALVTAAAEPPVKAALPSVTVRLATSLALAWAVALPVKVTVATVALVFVTTAVRPLGTLLTTAPARAAPLVPV